MRSGDSSGFSLLLRSRRASLDDGGSPAHHVIAYLGRTTWSGPSYIPVARLSQVSVPILPEPQQEHRPLKEDLSQIRATDSPIAPLTHRNIDGVFALTPMLGDRQM